MFSALSEPRGSFAQSSKQSQVKCGQFSKAAASISEFSGCSKFGQVPNRESGEHCF